MNDSAIILRLHITKVRSTAFKHKKVTHADENTHIDSHLHKLYIYIYIHIHIINSYKGDFLDKCLNACQKGEYLADCSLKNVACLNTKFQKG